MDQKPVWPCCLKVCLLKGSQIQDRKTEAQWNKINLIKDGNQFFSYPWDPDSTTLKVITAKVPKIAYFVLYILLCDARFSLKGLKTWHRNTRLGWVNVQIDGVQGKHLAVREKTGGPGEICSSLWSKRQPDDDDEPHIPNRPADLQPDAAQGPHKRLLSALQKIWGLPFSMSVISAELFYHSSLLLCPLCLQTKAFDRTWGEADV